MATEINWLLLSDLHYGLDAQNWLWPKVKHDIFTDIKKLEDQIGCFDIVFFTGDFVQTGKRLEYESLNRDLEELWKTFSKSNHIPTLCPVPGNHDLLRPTESSTVLSALTKHWWQDIDFQRIFWKDKNSEGRLFIDQIFGNYNWWLSNLPVPLMKRISGALPGDFSAIYVKNNETIGVIGLNSCFLQLNNDDYKGKLTLHVSQLNEVCGGDVTKWTKEHTANLLITHQPPSWLAPESIVHYREEIYPPGRFISHMYGHQHEPETSEISEAGGQPRRFRQGSSLFGLEEWRGVTPQKRLHGYLAGQFIIDGANSLEKIWPRTAIPGRHGAWNICPDHSFVLTDSNNIVASLEMDDGLSEERIPAGIAQGQAVAIKVSQEKVSSELHLLDKELNTEEAKKYLSNCQRFKSPVLPHHKSIRQEEQSQFEHNIRKNRIVWLIADWGSGKEGFLAAALNRFTDQKAPNDIFHLFCDDSEDENAFQSLFPKQFGMSLQAFCRCVSCLPDVFLILDNIPHLMCDENNFSKLKQIASAILDYCPQLNIVFLSRTQPSSNSFSTIELKPLDQPEVRIYVINHPDASHNLHESDIIEKLHERSDGLPMHLDRMLRALQVSTLESVLNAEMEGSTNLVNLVETIPKPLIQVITSLSKSNDKNSQRSFLLLKVLSVMPYGETIETLAHFLPSKPFFINNALELKELALLNTIPLVHTSPCVGINNNTLSEECVPKILKVPRQIGQYVLTLLSENERSEIIIAGVERFFGRRWREGKVKLRTIPVEYREYLCSGAGNEFAVIHHLIVDATKDLDNPTIRKALKLGIQYCNNLKSEDRYRDLAVVASGLIQAINQYEMPEQWSELAALNGSALRMTNKRNEALIMLHHALETGSHMSNDQKAHIWIDIAHAENSLKHKDLSITAAKEVMKITEPDSFNYLNALSIEASQTLAGEKKNNRLRFLERKARKLKYTTIANNITLELVSANEKPQENIRLLDKVINSEDRGYTQIRALVSKAETLNKAADSIEELSATNTNALPAAYTYLYSQRLGSLFDRCHDVLWNILEKKGETSQLIKLFRHSSFVWRIQGNEEIEKKYINRLSADVPETSKNQAIKTVSQEIKYFLNRVKAIIKL